MGMALMKWNYLHKCASNNENFLGKVDETIIYKALVVNGITNKEKVKDVVAYETLDGGVHIYLDGYLVAKVFPAVVEPVVGKHEIEIKTTIPFELFEKHKGERDVIVLEYTPEQENENVYLIPNIMRIGFNDLRVTCPYCKEELILSSEEDSEAKLCEHIVEARPKGLTFVKEGKVLK